jgi:hypothetical protein
MKFQWGRERLPGFAMPVDSQRSISAGNEPINQLNLSLDISSCLTVGPAVRYRTNLYDSAQRRFLIAIYPVIFLILLIPL